LRRPDLHFLRRRFERIEVCVWLFVHLNHVSRLTCP
jgi:hypothetical protein